MRTTTSLIERTSDRMVVLIDLENELGDPDAGPEDIIAFWDAFRAHAVLLRSVDQVIVATGHRMAASAWFALPQHGIRRLVRGGHDGADLALLEAIDLDHYARRFGRLVIASGDHAFTPLAQDARRRGMTVHQVIGRGIPSRALMAACPTRTWLKLSQDAGLHAYRDRYMGALRDWEHSARRARAPQTGALEASIH